MPTTAEVDEQDTAEEQARARLRRGRQVAALVAAFLVVVVGGVALLGGFKERSDLLTSVAVGSVITTGSLEVSFDQATVEHVTSSGEWRVVASGTALTTGTTSIDPAGDGDYLAAKSPSTSEVEPSYSVQVGAEDSSSNVDQLTPGLPPVPWWATFTFKQDPGSTVLVAVFGQQYTTPYIFGTEKGWQATRDASVMTLAVRRKPDLTY